MAKTIKNRQKHSRRKTIIFVAAILVSTAVCYLIYRHKNNSPKISPTPVPSITQLPADSSVDVDKKSPTTTTNSNNGTATDNQGQVSSPLTTNAGEWTKSASGVITVKQPISDEIIKSGIELVGTSSADKVQYRLLDNQAGVISRGFINVVNGSFSANLGFKALGKSGRLDVFTANDNGVESNEVQITIRF